MHTIRVWDLPTRLCHWAMVLCLAGLIATGEIGGAAFEWHFPLGYAMLSLLLFRVLWGLFGGYWSRFATFIPSPRSVWRYLRGQHPHHPGHNPLGALSVLGLLSVLLLQVGSGLMGDDDIEWAGPLAAHVPGEWVSWATQYHNDIGLPLVIALISLHIAAIAFYSFKKHKPLVGAMVHGNQSSPQAERSSRDDALSRSLAALLLLLCSAAVVAAVRWASGV